MLITPASVQMQQHVDAREGMTNKFNYMLENIINENTHRNKYWILGKAKIEKKKGKDIVRPFL